MSEKSKPNQNRNRRQFLAASTTAGLALLAGCGSSGNNSTNATPTSTPIPTTSGPAQFARLSLTGPSKVTLGNPVSLTFAATNIGGETGTLSTHIRVSEGRSTLDMAVELPIDPGECEKIQIEQIQFDVADSYTFTVGSSNVSHTVTVTPKTAAFGKTFNLSDTLKATVKSIDFRPSLLYSPSKSEQTFLEQPSTNNLLAIIRVDLENGGSKSATFDSAFQLQDGELRQALGNSTSLSAAKIDGKPLTGIRLSPGQQRSGWLLGEIPRSKAKKAVTVAYQRDTTGTPPEIEWTSTPKQGTRDLPQFAIESLQLPKTAQQGQDVTANVTISNKANSTRTFRGLVQSRVNDSENENWQSSAPITAQIPAGQSIQQNVTINGSSGGTVSYRLAPFNKTKTIEYVPPTFAFGETYTTTENVEVTVSDLQTATSLQVSPIGWDTESRVTSPSGERFVLFRVESVVTGESEGTPRSEEFSVLKGSQTIENSVTEKIDGITQTIFHAPVNARGYGGVDAPDEGEQFAGYLVYSIPQQVALGDLTVQWMSYENSTGAQGETARWAKGGSSSR